MTEFPLMQILFWIALNVSPQHTTHIVVNGPDETWIWAKLDSGWIQSVDQSVWVVDGSSVINRSGDRIDKRDLSEFVNGVKRQDWNKSPHLKLSPMRSLTRKGDTFVFTLNEGDAAEKRFVIGFKKK
jgi:hypothetical protein